MTKPVRLLYVDDSGAEKAGLAVLGWIEVDMDQWSEVLGQVLAWRQHLAKEFGIPKGYELHAVHFLNGRGNPSKTDAEWNRLKRHRLAIADNLCARMRAWPIRVFAIYRETAARRHEFKLVRDQLYEEFVVGNDRILSDEGAQALIVVDGDGTDSAYRHAHRELPLCSRAIIEDPLFQHSQGSLLVQIADFVSYAAYLAVARPSKKESMWGWFEQLGGELIKKQTR